MFLWAQCCPQQVRRINAGAAVPAKQPTPGHVVHRTNFQNIREDVEPGRTPSTAAAATGLVPKAIRSHVDLQICTQEVPAAWNISSRTLNPPPDPPVTPLRNHTERSEHDSGFLQPVLQLQQDQDQQERRGPQTST